MAAARANLLEVLTPEAYEHLERLGERMAGAAVGPGALAPRLEGMRVHRRAAATRERSRADLDLAG